MCGRFCPDHVAYKRIRPLANQGSILEEEEDEEEEEEEDEEEEQGGMGPPHSAPRFVP